MSRVIAITNQKGGVGKTTTAINLGFALLEKGHSVLLIDLDPQASLSQSFGYHLESTEHSIYQALLRPDVTMEQVLRYPRPGKPLAVAPANIDLAAAELELVNRPRRPYALQDALQPIRARFDFTLIDCGPNLGLLTVNALVAADEIIVPLLAEFLALRGMHTLFETIARVRQGLNPHLKIDGILGTMYDKRTIHGREVLEEAREVYGTYVFPFIVRKSIRFAEAPALGKALLEHAPHHPGAEAYRQLAEVLINGRK